MLSERIRAAVERAANLPAELQERVASEIESAIDNAVWDAQLRDPANRPIHEALIAEALAGPALPPPTAEELGLSDDLGDDDDAE